MYRLHCKKYHKVCKNSICTYICVKFQKFLGISNCAMNNLAINNLTFLSRIERNRGAVKSVRRKCYHFPYF